MLTLRILPQQFSVCKITSPEGVDFTAPFVFLSKTDDELSLVCEARSVPADTTDVEPGWRCLKITGQLDFALVGILAKISGILAEAGISLFAISTYNTDYILVKEPALEKAAALLQNAGYTIDSSPV